MAFTGENCPISSVQTLEPCHQTSFRNLCKGIAGTEQPPATTVVLQEQCTAIAVWRASDPGKIPSNGHRASCSFSPRDPHIVVFTSPSSQVSIVLLPEWLNRFSLL